MERYLHCATCFWVWFSICHRKKLDFLSLSNIFTKSINRVPIHTVPLYVLGQILGKKHIKTPSPPYGGYTHQQQIFLHISCPLVIQTLDSDFWTFCGTQLQEGNGSYIVSYFDDDDDVKAKMISVIIGATRTISRSFRKYLSNIPGKHEISGVQKKKNSRIGHCTQLQFRKH